MYHESLLIPKLQGTDSGTTDGLLPASQPRARRARDLAQDRDIERLDSLFEGDGDPLGNQISDLQPLLAIHPPGERASVGLPILPSERGLVYAIEEGRSVAEKVFIQLVDLLFHPVIAGICLAAILAAVMSTADSQLLVASSAFTEDFYRALLRRDAGDRELVLTGRVAVLSVALIAFLLALDPESKVLDLVAYAWAGFGAAFGPALLLSLYWKRMTGTGALAGIITGGLTVVVWKQMGGGFFDLYEIVPGILLSTAAIVAASLADRPPTDETQEEFEEVQRKLDASGR